MGSCLTSCLPASEAARHLCNFKILQRRQSDFTFLVEEESGPPQVPKKSNFISTIFKKHKENRNRPVLEMVDNLLNPQLSYNRLSESQRLPSTSSCTSKDIQLQCLDARALLVQTNTSTPEHSVDLEWEHETLPHSGMNDSMLSKSSWGSTLRDDTLLPQRPTPLPSDGPASDSEWSRVSSSANSLEWDSVQNSIQSELDTDTQLLLNEIDRLTLQALKETGMVSSDGCGYLDDSVDE